jgi:cytochrome c
MKTTLVAPGVVLGAIVLSAAGCASLADPPTRAAGLAVDLGCATCHATRPVPLGRGMPIAPSWQEIAERYRRDPGAQEALADALLGGTEERHWKGSPFVTMLPHEKWIAPEDAHAIARWILAH